MHECNGIRIEVKQRQGSFPHRAVYPKCINLGASNGVDVGNGCSISSYSPILHNRSMSSFVLVLHLGLSSDRCPIKQKYIKIFE